MSPIPSPQVHEGELHHGFRVLRTAAVESIQCRFHELRHERLGTRFVHLAAQDRNNMFMVTLRTIPTDSTGVAHILEHSVLEGSCRYPVQTFKHLNGRTLHTFLNAMTSADYTAYPFATKNRKTWFDLLDLYCDAVFCPLLEDETFLQEAWRHEFEEPLDPGTPLTYRGVVYNEMKGALSNPLRIFHESIKQGLLPDLTYHNISGGDPRHMPELTIEAWRSFHARHYHPSNAFVYSYGDLPLPPTLERLDRDFLARFEPAEPVPPIPAQADFEEPRRQRFTFPVSAEQPVEGKTIAAVVWKVASTRNAEAMIQLRLLRDLLVGNLSSPLHQALLSSGLGEGLATVGLDSSLSEAIFGVGLKDMRAEDVDPMESLILETLTRLADEGIPRDALEASLHKMEYRTMARESHGLPYGWVLLNRALPAWLQGGDFLDALDVKPRLDRLKSAAASPDFVPALIRRHLLENRHRVTLLVSPEPGGLEKQEARTRNELESVREKLTDSEVKDLLDQARRMIAFQDKEEDLSCLPRVERSEIPPEEEIPQTIGSLGKRTVYRHGLSTNGIGYLTLSLESDRLADEDLIGLSITGVLSSLGAGGRSHQEVATLVDRYTGGIGVVAQPLDPIDGSASRLQLVLGASAFPRHFQTMTRIAGDILLEPDLEDRDRLSELIGLFKASALPSVFGNAPWLLLHAAGRGFSSSSRLQHELEGLGSLERFLGFSPAHVEDWTRRLQDGLRRMVQQRSATLGLTGEERDLPALEQAGGALLERLPEGTVERELPQAGRGVDSVREAWVLSTPVSYVARVVPVVPFQHADAPALTVLGQLMEKPLYSRVRAQGGAYGCWGIYSSEARSFGMISFRDPHTAHTLESFDAVVRDLAEGRFEPRDLEEAVIETIRSMDPALAPKAQGNLAMSRRLRGMTEEHRRRFREAILNTTRERIVAVVERYLVAPERTGIAVLSSDEILDGAEGRSMALQRRHLEPAK